MEKGIFTDFLPYSIFIPSRPSAMVPWAGILRVTSRSGFKGR